jgi:AATGal transferase
MAKHIFDFILATISITLLSPVFLAIALWIKLDSPGPVFFRQTRVGLHGNYFRIFKFRTMISDAESNGLKLTTSDDSRITKSGKLLRKFKLDELPQLLNIIMGEMSFIGPRPEVSEYVAYYTTGQKDVIFSVRPGITDEASIKFRNENELLAASADPQMEYIENILPVKLALYLKYVNERSFLGDLKIIYSTIINLLKHETLEK